VTARDFIAVGREGFEKGVNVLRFLGGFTADVAGTVREDDRWQIVRRQPIYEKDRLDPVGYRHLACSGSTGQLTPWGCPAPEPT
jgi:hypothetical protein